MAYVSLKEGTQGGVWFGNCQDIETGPYCFKVSKGKNLIRPSERSTLD